MNNISVVRNSDQHITSFDKTKIANSVFKEINYVAETLDLPPQITKGEAHFIANKVEKTIGKLKFNFLSGPLIREITSMELLKFDDKRGNNDFNLRKFYTRVGLPVADAVLINNANSDETTDNANQADNPETFHKKYGDAVGKELTMLLLPHELADAHMRGDLHIHDREYFASRTFCVDGITAIPIKCNDNVSVMKLTDLDFNEKDYILPENVCAFTPKGCREITKITRRKVEKDEKILNIKLSNGKSVKITKEHRIPINIENKMVIKKADELKNGDIFYTTKDNSIFNMRGEPIENINLVKELTDKVPSHLLENVYVRKLKPIFNKLSLSPSKLVKVLQSLEIKNTQINWFNKGIMPIISFKKFADFYDIQDYKGAVISTGGSQHELSIIFPISSELVKILGYFVADGNYNDNNLVITGNNTVSNINEYTKKVFNTYATIIERKEITNIMGREGNWKKGKQIYFGGKISKLIFKYVFGIPERATNKRLPNIAYNLNDELLHDFLSALFSGDGTAYYDVKKSSCLITYSTTSEILKQELTMLLTSLGMNPGVIKHPREKDGYKDLYRVRLTGRKNIEMFKKHVTFYNKNQENIDSFLSNVNGIKRITTETIKEISSIESSGKYVYDIFLKHGKSEEEHTFFASDGLLIHNCMDHDLRFWFYYGFDSDCTGNTNIAGAAQHANVAILHCAKILGSAQTNFAGGQGFYNFLTFLAPYFEGMSYKQIEQLMQMFIFEMAQTMCARGGQVVFSSVQLPPGVPTLWKDQPVIYKGKKWDGNNGTIRRVYGDFEREVRLGFEAIMKVMLKGDVWGKPFNFPKPEVAFEKEFLTKHEDDIYFNDDSVRTYSELYDLVFELTAKHGTPYFDNMVPDYRDTGGIECYQCCSFSFSATMESDDKYQDKIDFKDGEHFSMGGVQVVSLNSPRAAYKAKQNDFDSLIVESKKIIEQAISIQKIKKQWMKRQFDKGLVPFATQQLTHPVTKEKSPPLVDFDELVYIIGMVGLNEVAWHHTGHQLSTQEGYEFGVRYMNHLKSYIHTRGDEEGINLVLARTPAETTCQRFAVSDLINYPKFAKKYVSGDLKEAEKKLHKSRNLPVYYSNGTHLPVDMDVPFTERINIEETFFPILDGGNIFHIWLNEENPDPQGVKDFVMNIIKNTLVGYFALTKNTTICRDCYKQSGGIHDECPHCDSENVESFSRITGYIQSTAGWNEAKKEELKRRLKTNIG